MKTNIKIAKLLISLFIISNLFGCAATHTAVNKRDLDVQTKMSATVFLDPVAPEKRTVFVQVRNTTDKFELSLENPIRNSIEAKGYTIVSNPDRAHYLLQANVLHVGKSDLRAAQHALNGGYGGAVSGAMIGGAAGAIGSSSSDGVLIGALVGSAVSTIADAMVKDVSFSAITDIQISERVGKTVVVREKTKSKLKQGTSGSKEVTSTEKTSWKRYQTRIVSTANKVNLKFEEASEKLADGLTRSIAGIF